MFFIRCYFNIFRVFLVFIYDEWNQHVQTSHLVSLSAIGLVWTIWYVCVSDRWVCKIILSHIHMVNMMMSEEQWPWKTPGWKNHVTQFEHTQIHLSTFVFLCLWNVDSSLSTDAKETQRTATHQYIYQCGTEEYPTNHKEQFFFLSSPVTAVCHSHSQPLHLHGHSEHIILVIKSTSMHFRICAMAAHSAP